MSERPDDTVRRRRQSSCRNVLALLQNGQLKLSLFRATIVACAHLRDGESDPMQTVKGDIIWPGGTDYGKHSLPKTVEGTIFGGGHLSA